MIFTDDEITVTVEALREYRLRVADASRRFLCEALIYRFGEQLIQNAKDALNGPDHAQPR